MKITSSLRRNPLVFLFPHLGCKLSRLAFEENVDLQFFFHLINFLRAEKLEGGLLVEGIVVEWFFLLSIAQSSFLLVNSLSGSMELANCKFLTVYSALLFF